MLTRMLFIIALAMPALSYGAVYQCTANGQTVFSDQPCGDDAKELDHKPAPAIGGRFDTGTDVEFYKPPARQNSSSEESCPYINSTELRRLTIQNKITRGMKPADVRRSWGSPSSISTGRRTQWAYHYTGGSSSYVYFENGCVVNWNGYYR
ncbi:DUF4124 domain-containing protein [Marinobacter sp. KMM 10035]|uniref:DUF4124 domain-containing protein n=1 Tax=Marinobacter sp. KMM 10035 TaxID=3134034 RepID=UPI003978F76D